MDLTYYKPNPIEAWINEKYVAAGIKYPSDMELDRIAEIFSIEVRLYAGPCFAEWEEGEHAFIFLDGRLGCAQRREVFFHELCHPVRHYGRQELLPETFIQLQETEAANFQLYAGLPLHLLMDFQDVQEPQLQIVMAEEFSLPEDFVIQRLRQIKSRMYFEQHDQRRREQIRQPMKLPEGHVEHVLAELAKQYKEREGA